MGPGGLRSLVVVLLVLCVGLGGCRLSKDAVAASQQMSATALTLEAYYDALLQEQGETISLLEIDSALSGVPYRAEDSKQPVDTEAELLARKQMAVSLAALADSVTTLTNLKSANDAQVSATALGNALISAKALSPESTVPGSLGEAGRLLIRLAQQHDERKAAQAMDQTLAAVCDLFAKEQPVYDSIGRFRFRQAAAIAKDLEATNALDVTPLLNSSLQPFGLGALPVSPEVQTRLRQLAMQRVQRTVQEQAQRQGDASVAMLGGLREMSRRVHVLATGGRLAARSQPVPLHTVNEWLHTMSQDRELR